MADKLNWQNRHYILFRCKYVDDLVKNEGYKIPKAYQPLVTPNLAIEDFLEKLIQADALKDACDLIAYAIHHRVGIWWGLCCLKDLCAEPPKTEPGEEDAEPPEIPEAEAEKEAKEDAEASPDLKALQENWKKMSENLAKQEETMGKDGMKLVSNTAAQLPSASQLIFWQTRQKVDRIFLASAGVSFHDLLGAGSALMKKSKGKAPDIRKGMDGLKKKSGQSGAALAEKPDALLSPEEKTDNSEERKAAMEAVSGWVIMPDRIHTQNVLECGNEASGTPEGMLALSAFWSYGNLMLNETENIIKTPPGLAANGLRMALLLMILDERGSLSPRERVTRYLQLGQDAAQCRNLWDEEALAISSGKDPFPSPLPKTNSAPADEGVSVYKKWG